MKKTLTTLFGLSVACATGMLHAEDIKGDAKAGAGKIAMCIGCHGIPGYQSSFPQVHKVPKIGGQGAKYIESALNAYKKGERKFPSMRAIADSLSEQDIADVAAYYAEHGTQADLPAKPTLEPNAQVAQLLQKGACVSCHGENFAKPIDPSYPKIAGQYADYLFVALKQYKNDQGAYVGRSNAIMGGIAKQFTNAELKALAGYIGALPDDLKVVTESRFR
ncbi:MAG: cytochrome c4 [Proteobacteria bacterium]|nr:cytochrome c4 [Pseudomonadota bacterium]MBS0611421.1 cytochrome c4 [Pseudomonadota bacterium]